MNEIFKLWLDDQFASAAKGNRRYTPMPKRPGKRIRAVRIPDLRPGESVQYEMPHPAIKECAWQVNQACAIIGLLWRQENFPTTVYPS